MFHHFHDDAWHTRGQGSISAEQLSQILDYARKHYNLIDAHVYESKVISGTLSERDVVLTFDDALKSQYDIALPVLQDYNIKAYFFVYTNAFIDHPDPLEFYRDYRNSFFDSIEDFYRLFFKEFKVTKPDLFKEYLSLYPSNYLASFPFYTESDRRFRFARDKILGNDSYYALMESMIYHSGYNKNERKSHLFMTKDDLKTLSARGHVIGLHSTSHPTTLDALSSERQLSEYTQNQIFVHSLTGSSPLSMSHPCGRYNSDTLHILSSLGIKVGFCSSIREPSLRSPLEIPREDHSNVLAFINS